MIKRQRGITFIGFVIILSLVIFAGFIGIRLFPMYQEYFSVVQAMQGVASEPDAPQMSIQEARTAIGRRLDINYVASVGPQNFLLTRGPTGPVLSITYEVRRELVGNLDIVGKFEKTVPMDGR